MITTHSHWSTDISKAPRGETVTTTQTVLVKGQPQERSQSVHVPTKILALTTNGPDKVIVVPTYWLPPEHTVTGHVLNGDRWSGFNRGEQPLAWAEWPDADDLMASIKVITAAAPVLDEEDAA